MGEKCIVPNAVGVIGHRGKKIEAWTKSHTLQKNELKVNYVLMIAMILTWTLCSLIDKFFL